MKTFISILDLKQKLSEIDFPKLDLVIGIATGSTVLASLLAYQLNLPLQLIRINYRDEDNKPRHHSPLILKNLAYELLKNKHILLVDDVSVSGKTLNLAKEMITAQKVYTLLIKGEADYTLFPDIKTCIDLPWRI